jgi:hypothetical protein
MHRNGVGLEVLKCTQFRATNFENPMEIQLAGKPPFPRESAKFRVNSVAREIAEIAR